MVQIAELREQLGGLASPVEARGIWRGIWLEETHHSTAIDGNTLALRQVEQLLAEGRAVGNKELREYLEVQGYANAAGWVYAQGIQPTEWSRRELISLAELRHAHRLVLAPVWNVALHPAASESERPGAFRECDVEPFAGGIGMRPPPWRDVPVDVSDWISEAQSLRAATPTVEAEALARLHARFERIHPFLDGNGRTGRLALNLLLVRCGYPPAILYKRDRDRYMAALRRADGGDHGPLAELIARAVLDNLHRFVMRAAPSPLVPLQGLATAEMSANALRVAATRGRLEASKGPDGTWRSTRAWVEEYLGGRYRRGRLRSETT